MKKNNVYTCRKRNEAGQKAINCIHYNSLELKETWIDCEKWIYIGE